MFPVTISSQVGSEEEGDVLETSDLSDLVEIGQLQVQSLLQRFCSVFCLHEGDLGYTDLVYHDIPLLDKIPFRQLYQHIPLSE